MKMTIKNLLIVGVVLIAGMGMSSCVKIWEDELLETIHRPQIDIEPDAPDWDDEGTENIH